MGWFNPTSQTSYGHNPMMSQMPHSGQMALPSSAPHHRDGPSSMSEIAQSCEASARGASYGTTVTDNDIKVLGPDERPIPAEPYKTFDQAGREFTPELIDMLKRAGFPGPSQIQAHAWPLAVQGKDVIGIAATGSGKTLAFLLPAYSEFAKARMDPRRDGTGLLVMSPTRELAQQIETEAQRFGSCIGMRSVAMYGGAPKWDQMNKYRGGCHAIIATPGRLNDFLEGGQVRLDGVKKLVLDEADRMLDMGFEPQIRKILEKVPRRRHTMFFSATWPREVRKLAAEILHQPYTVMIGSREELKANQDVTQLVRIVGDKRSALNDLLREAGLMDRGSIGKALIFASTKRMCEQLYQDLHRAGVSCAAIHGDKGQHERDQALEGLKRGSLRMLVATDVAARGLDIRGVGLVINFDPANNSEDYVHRIGRTGRGKDGKGHALVFFEYSRSIPTCAAELISVLAHAKQPVPEALTRIADDVKQGKMEVKSWGGGGAWKSDWKKKEWTSEKKDWNAATTEKKDWNADGGWKSSWNNQDSNGKKSWEAGGNGDAGAAKHSSSGDAYADAFAAALGHRPLPAPAWAPSAPPRAFQWKPSPYATSQ